MSGSVDSVLTTISVQLRSVRREDLPAIIELFARSVETLAVPHYDAAARRVWAAGAQQESFARSVLAAETLVAHIDGDIAGFAGLLPGDHVEWLYVAPEASRRGVARRLVRALLESARRAGHRRVTTEASAIAQPVFERLGFRVLGEERVVREGTEFLRYRMQRDLDAGSE